MANEHFIVFPDYVYTGKIELTTRIESGIEDEIRNISANHDGVAPTNYGWFTLKEVPLKNNLRKLQLVVGTYFVNAIKQHFPHMLDRNIEVVEPNIYSIKPNHVISSNVFRNRWYTGVVWLQTSDMGSGIRLENFNTKLYSDPPGSMDYTHDISPAQFKYAFWPAHLPASFTPNRSMIDTVVMHCTFTGFPNPKK